MPIPFIKMQGLGNDFVVLDDLTGNAPWSPLITPEFAKKICDRRFGVGADQILWLRPAKTGSSADIQMDILNGDGSIAEMCGNGIRAVGLYLSEHGPLAKRPEYRIDTLAGLMTVQVRNDQVLVNMGAPKLGEGFKSAGEPIAVGGLSFRFFEVSTGNPHAIIFVEKVAEVELEKIGPLIEKHIRFPSRTNVEFVQVLGPDRIQVRVWERGAGATLACGTGACAAAVAALATGKVKGILEVLLPGGSLKISWKGEGQSVMMEGPAKEVFRGVY